jgi:hypothetical protein
MLSEPTAHRNRRHTVVSLKHFTKFTFLACYILLKSGALSVPVAKGRSFKLSNNTHLMQVCSLRRPLGLMTEHTFEATQLLLVFFVWNGEEDSWSLSGIELWFRRYSAWSITTILTRIFSSRTWGKKPNIVKVENFLKSVIKRVFWKST